MSDFSDLKTVHFKLQCKDNFSTHQPACIGTVSGTMGLQRLSHFLKYRAFQDAFVLCRFPFLSVFRTLVGLGRNHIVSAWIFAALYFMDSIYYLHYFLPIEAGYSKNIWTISENISFAICYCFIMVLKESGPYFWKLDKKKSIAAVSSNPWA